MSICGGIWSSPENTILTAFSWKPLFSVSSDKAFCTSSLLKGIKDILLPSNLYEVNEFESNINLPVSVSLTIIAELGSSCTWVSTVLINSLLTTSLDANFKRLLNGILSSSGYSVKYLDVRAFSLMFG